MYFGRILRDEWLVSFDKEDSVDSFAQNFADRADNDNLWKHAIGLYVDELLVGGYISVIENDVNNFKLLHVFDRYRGNDYGSKLLMHSYEKGKEEADYFKVTSEKSALGFYDKLGFKFWGEHDYGPYYLILGKYNAFGTLKYDLDSTMYNIMKTKYKLKGGIPSCALSLEAMMQTSSSS